MLLRLFDSTKLCVEGGQGNGQKYFATGHILHSIVFMLIMNAYQSKE